MVSDQVLGSGLWKGGGGMRILRLRTALSGGLGGGSAFFMGGDRQGENDGSRDGQFVTSFSLVVIYPSPPLLSSRISEEGESESASISQRKES